MRILTLILCAVVLITTGLPMINTDEWWIRIFDFPRIQIAFLALITIILAYVYLDFKRVYKLPFLFILIILLLYQLQFVLVYTPIYQTKAKESNEPKRNSSLKLMVSNVLMENEEKDRFLSLVRKVNPDVLLINEPNQSWANHIKSLEQDYQYSVKYPMENTYGMILLSKLKLTESKVNFLVQDDIPSIFTKITLASGIIIDFYGVHPEPPKPGSDTYERDTELLIIGKKISESNNPTIVAGDMNDVGWSDTSKLFRKSSGLVDPREGRGLFNTFSVSLPLLRYPLDHIFYSKEFGLINIQKLENIGSDHFPILIGLNYEPDSDNFQGIEDVISKEKAEVEKLIEYGKKKSIVI